MPRSTVQIRDGAPSQISYGINIFVGFFYLFCLTLLSFFILYDINKLILKNRR